MSSVSVQVQSRMASGMIKYTNASIETMAEYNEYCYYVAGLVGVGLTKLIQSNCVLGNEPDLQRLAISTGIFLQKNNILHDIYEDMSSPTECCFIPKEVWENYVKNDRDLIDRNCLPRAISCLNFLISDAFQHLPDSRIRPFLIRMLSFRERKLVTFWTMLQT